MTPHHFFATTPKNMESLLTDELRSLGGEEISETRAGASFSGNPGNRLSNLPMVHGSQTGYYWYWDAFLLPHRMRYTLAYSTSHGLSISHLLKRSL